jgi:hypothetical protein
MGRCKFTCIVERRHVVFQCGHVTLLIQVGGAAREGDGCRGEGEGDGGYVCGCGVVPGWWGEGLDDVVASGRECAHIVVIVLVLISAGP